MKTILMQLNLLNGTARFSEFIVKLREIQNRIVQKWDLKAYMHAHCQCVCQSRAEFNIRRK